MQPQRCLNCSHTVTLIPVHGHYQCPHCGMNMLPCCDGDNCLTNHFLSDPPITGSEPAGPPIRLNPEEM